MLIQLLTTHEDIQSTDEFTSLYEKLSDIVHNCEGEISFEILDNKSDSLVILFRINFKVRNLRPFFVFVVLFKYCSSYANYIEMLIEMI